MFGRRKRRQPTFRPSLEQEGGALESRSLMSVATFRAFHRRPPVARRHLALPLPDNNHRLIEGGLPTSPRNYVQTGVGNGGRAAVMVDTDGEIYVAHVTGGGTVRAKAAPGGKVDLYLYGTNVDSVLTIDPEPPSIFAGGAHQFATGTTLQDTLLHVRNIKVTNGHVSGILGYKTADLSGNLSVISNSGPQTNVDRIAFYNILPGASIAVGSDLDTLDVYNTLYLNGGPGIQVGRDLDFLSTGQTMILANGASLITGRDFGPFVQAAKGSGPGGSGAIIQGDLIVGPGSTIAAARFNYGPIIVRGDIAGLENLPPETQDVVYLQRDGAVFPVT